MTQNVIITGASRGIGKSIVEAFAKNGDNIWAFIRKDSSEFTKFINSLQRQNNIWIKPIYVELTQSESIKNAYKQIALERKSVDVLVNCAGLGHMNLFQMSTLEVIRNIYEVNVFALMYACQYTLRFMIKQKKGKIINIASTAAYEVYVGNSIYGSSKASVIAFTKSLASEVAKNGIQVNAIAPGLTDTKMSVIFDGNDASLPLARSAIERKLLPSEVASVVVAMTDEKMQMVNGQVIVVNGGSK